MKEEISESEKENAIRLSAIDAAYRAADYAGMAVIENERHCARMSASEVLYVTS